MTYQYKTFPRFTKFKDIFDLVTAHVIRAHRKKDSGAPNIDPVKLESRFWMMVTHIFDKQRQRSLKDVIGFYAVEPFFIDIDELRYLGGLYQDPLVEAMVRLGILERSVYKTNEFKKDVYNYRLHPSHIQHDYRIVEAEMKNQRNSYDKLRNYKLRHLTGVDLDVSQRLVNCEFGIDLELFNRIVGKRYPDYVTAKKFLGKPYLPWSDYYAVQMQQYRMADDWNKMTPEQRLMTFSVDSFGKRLHSVFTRLMKEFRAHIYLDGKLLKLVEADIQCSQPTFLANHINNTIGWTRFVSHVANYETDIYERIAANLDISRDLAKVKMMTYLYCRNNNGHQKEFENLYWDTGQWTRNIKNQPCRYIGKSGRLVVKESHCSLSRQLQLNESATMRKVWERLLARDRRFIPIHDAVYLEAKKGHNCICREMKDVLSQELAFFNMRFKAVK